MKMEAFSLSDYSEYPNLYKEIGKQKRCDRLNEKYQEN